MATTLKDSRSPSRRPSNGKIKANPAAVARIAATNIRPLTVDEAEDIVELLDGVEPCSLDEDRWISEVSGRHTFDTQELRSLGDRLAQVGKVMAAISRAVELTGEHRVSLPSLSNLSREVEYFETFAEAATSRAVDEVGHIRFKHVLRTSTRHNPDSVTAHGLKSLAQQLRRRSSKLCELAGAMDNRNIQGITVVGWDVTRDLLKGLQGSTECGFDLIHGDKRGY